MTVKTDQKFKDRLADRVVREREQDRVPTRPAPHDLLRGQFPPKCVQTLVLGITLCRGRSPGLRYDIRVRICKAMSHCGKLRHLFDLPAHGPWLKIRLYVVSVISLLTYGCEPWNLTEDVMRKFNGTNSQMFSRITDNDVLTEARSSTSSFDVVKHIRVRRPRWLGQILRGNQGRLLFKSMECQHDMRNPGNLFMDAPPHVNLQDLVNQSYDKNFWKSLESFIPSHLRGVTIYTV